LLSIGVKTLSRPRRSAGAQTEEDTYGRQRDHRPVLAAVLVGGYVTTVPEAFPGEEHIAKVELVYRNSRCDPYLMPYYRFYVELPDMAQGNGLKTYGAYYVPAVYAAFLTGVPVWEGEFN